MRVTTNSWQQTEALGEWLGSRLSGGEVIALFGPMGMGKTAFTRGIARGLGVADEISQPHLCARPRARGKGAALPF